MLSVNEEEFFNLAEDLKPHMVEAMKIEVAPWIKEYVTDVDDLYTELSLEKLNDKACGQHREELNSYKELFTEGETPKLESGTNMPIGGSRGGAPGARPPPFAWHPSF